MKSYIATLSSKTESFKSGNLSDIRNWAKSNGVIGEVLSIARSESPLKVEKTLIIEAKDIERTGFIGMKAELAVYNGVNMF